MNRNRFSGRWGAGWPLAMLLAAGLAACGGSDDNDSQDGGGTPDPLTVYREQKVDWAPCDDTILGGRNSEEYAAYQSIVQRMGERLQCARVRAPLDWAKPDRGDVSLAVIRLTSSEPAQRKGTLLFNPGGPGADGLTAWMNLYGAFRLARPDTPDGAQQVKLLASYDLLGFSPRGTGASTRVSCQTNEQERYARASIPGPRAEDIANASYNAQRLAEACLRSPLTPYINTDATARDMDLIRGLLGDEKLNYVGYSYGTWLGAWYASLFPERVGRMVLDSAEDASQPIEQALIAKPVARQRVQDEILLPYAARHAAHFGLGNDAAEIQRMLTGLAPALQEVLGNILSSNSYGADQADDSLAAMLATRGLDTVMRAVDAHDKTAVWAGLSDMVFLPDDPERDQSARERAWKIYSTYRASEQPALGPIGEDPGVWPVRCNDTVSTTDVAQWTALIHQQATLAPMYYGVILGNPCSYWGGPRVTKPSIDPLKKLDIMMVQSQYDAATPAPDADLFFAQLPAAHRMYVPGEYGHGVFPYQDSCVDRGVVNYLLGEAPAQRQTDCPAKPLAQDQMQVARKDAATASNYTDPEAAARLIARFKQSLHADGR